jgi:uncharacterized membrane protein SpoIIM required for sporulation
MTSSPRTSGVVERRTLKRLSDLERKIRNRLAVARGASQSSAEEGAPGRVSAALEVLTAYDELGAELYRVREYLPATHHERRKLEDTASDLAFELLATSAPAISSQSAYGRWLARYRAIWKRELPILIFCAIFFLGSALVGFATAVQSPEYVPVMVPQSLMEDVMDGRAWFAKIQENPMLFGAMIGWNNIKVAINCFLGGAILGLGGLLMVCFNGVHIGSIFGFCAAKGFDDELSAFVVSHGFLELSIIVAAGAASLVYGRAFFMRPYREFPRRLSEGARDAGVMALGIIPWLVLAACFEAFVSPFDYLSVTAKLIAGLLLGGLFWGWTFWTGEVRAEGEDA